MNKSRIFYEIMIKKNSAGEIIIQNFKIYHRAVIIKRQCTRTKPDMKTNKTPKYIITLKILICCKRLRVHFLAAYKLKNHSKTILFKTQFGQ